MEMIFVRTGSTERLDLTVPKVVDLLDTTITIIIEMVFFQLLCLTMMNSRSRGSDNDDEPIAPAPKKRRPNPAPAAYSFQCG